MAAPNQIRAQFLKVINLAVVDDPSRLIFVEERLMTARQVDDAEAAHAQTGAILDEDAFVVRPTMNDHVAHATDRRFVYATPASLATMPAIPHIT